METSVVCCCKLINTQVCDEHLFGQVSTGGYQLPIFRCTNVHLQRYARPLFRRAVYWWRHETQYVYNTETFFLLSDDNESIKEYTDVVQSQLLEDKRNFFASLSLSFFHLSLSLSLFHLSFSRMSPLIKNCETCLIRGRKLIRVTQKI